MLEYGRLIDFVLPGPTDNGNGVIFEPPFNLEDYSSSMDTLQLEMLIQSEIQKYINTIISIQNSYDLDNDNSLDDGENEDGIINIYNDDYINIQSYISFKVNPSGF